MRRIGVLLGLVAGLHAAGNLDLALPVYQPGTTVRGGISSVGDDALEPLMNAWLAAFQQHQPEVTRGERWWHPGGAAAVGALMLETADVAPLGRELWPAELAPYAHQFKGDMMKEPLLIRIGTGSFRPAGQAGAIALYVNARNPLRQLSLAQLDAIFGAQRRRGAALPLTRWGQLGLTGEWADQPIVPVATPDYSTPAQLMQNRVLLGGLWSAGLEPVQSAVAAVQFVAEHPGAIAFAGFMDAPETRTVAIAEADGSSAVTATEATVADGSYPLGRAIYLAVNQRPGAPLPAKTAEFLSFVLSREGQSILAQYPYFYPLPAQDAARERAKLDGYLPPVDPAIVPYHASGQVSGPIANVGSDGMESLMEKWMTAFCRIHPGVHRGAHWSHQGTLNGFQALLAGETDLAPMGRELWPGEKAIYHAIRGQAEPLEIRVARGGFNTPQRTTAQAVFVNERNPLVGLTVPQLDAILGRERRQGDTEPITRWGQLGLTGEWQDRPITMYVPYRITPNAMSVQINVLLGGPWSPDLHEASVAEVAAAVARDPGAIAFGGFEEGGPGLKPLSLAVKAGDPYIAGTAADVASGRYPLTRYMYIRLNREPGHPLPSQVREFLRFILSRDGQEFIPTSAYFPLGADEVAAELEKLK